MDWLKARLRERSTWAAVLLFVIALAAPRLGFNYADVKDAILMLSAALFAHKEAGKA